MKGVCEILGSGTSVGVPMPGCSCRGCMSGDERDKRFRSSARLTINGLEIIIDTTTDLRIQSLRSGLQRIDAVLLTHNHADHVMGLDDVRPFCFKQPEPIPVYGSKETLDWVRGHFNYIWEATQIGGGLPRIKLNPVDSEFNYEGVCIIPLPVKHGVMDIYGFRIGDLAYICDVSFIPETTFDLLEGINYLVIDGLRPKEHATHFSIDQAVTAAKRINASQTWLTHISHDSLYAELVQTLPARIAPAYDGLKFEFEA